MRSVQIIALNTFREIVRDRVLYGLVVFSILLIGFSLVLGNLSFSEQARISIDFGFSGIQLSSVILSIFVGSTLVSKEIEKQTLMTLLARPLSRFEFVIGKFVGLGLVVTIAVLGLFGVLLLLTFIMKWAINLAFFISLVGILAESILLMAMTIFFGMISKPILAVSYSLSLFLLGHWIGDLPYFAEKSSSASFKFFSKIIEYVIPNLEMFDFRSAAIYGDEIPAAQLLRTMVYAVSWIALCLTGAGILFKRKDFG